MANRTYTKERVLEAIDGTAGIVSALAARLECAWETASKLVDRWEETRVAWKAEREKVLDLAESTLVKNIQAGDSGDAKWVLARLGRHRGWGDQVAVEHSGEVKTILVNLGEDVTKL